MEVCCGMTLFEAHNGISKGGQATLNHWSGVSCGIEGSAVAFLHLTSSGTHCNNILE